MQIQITAVSDPALIAAAARHGQRRPVLAARLAGWAFLLLAVSVLAVTGELSPALLAIGAALAVVVPPALLHHTARGLRTEQVTTYEISAGGIASSNAESRHSYAWRAVRSVEHLSGQLLFRLRGTHILPVPITGLAPEEVEQILGTASAHGLRVRRGSQRAG